MASTTRRRISPAVNPESKNTNYFKLLPGPASPSSLQLAKNDHSMPSVRASCSTDSENRNDMSKDSTNANTVESTKQKQESQQPESEPWGHWLLSDHESRPSPSVPLTPAPYPATLDPQSILSSEELDSVGQTDCQLHPHGLPTTKPRDFEQNPVELEVPKLASQSTISTSIPTSTFSMSIDKECTVVTDSWAETERPKKLKKTKESLIVHYSCPHCKKIFAFLNQFLRHTREHGREPAGRSKSLSQIIIESTIHLKEIMEPDHTVEELIAMNKLSFVEPPEKLNFQPAQGQERQEVNLIYENVTVPPCHGRSPSSSVSISSPPSSSPLTFSNELNFDLHDIISAYSEKQRVAADKTENDVEQDCKNSKTTAAIPDGKVKINEKISSPAFVCDMCKHYFRNKTSLKYHLKNRVCSRGVRETRYQRGPGQNRLKSLKKTVSIRPLRPLQCKHCKLKFTTLDYRYHIKNHACIRYKTKYERASSKILAPISVPLSTSSGKMHTCEVCQKGFNKRYPLVRHMRSHTGEKPYSCHHCPKNYSDSWHRNQHEKRVHNTHEEQRKTSSRTGVKLSIPPNPKPPGKMYSCEFCKKVFKNERYLKNHERIHAVHTGGKKPYVCGYCPKRFPSYSSRFQHEKHNHTKIKPYRCEICKKTFATNTNNFRKMHSRAHNGEKPYSCEYCKKAFPYPASLKYHRMRYHTGERPHSCTLCGKSFVQSSHLKYHLKTRHAGENSL